MTDPETCRHWVIKPARTNPDLFVECFSCGTIFDVKLPLSRTWADYDWNDEHGVWEYVSPRTRRIRKYGTPY